MLHNSMLENKNILKYFKCGFANKFSGCPPWGKNVPGGCHGNKLSGSMKYVKLFDQLSSSSILLHGVGQFTHTHTHGAEPFLRSRQLCSYSGTSQHFMEPEGSLPCSQEPSTGPSPETDRSSPYHPNLSLSLRDPF
jgi:hypothetical protein